MSSPARWLLLFPDTIEANLAAVARSGLVPRTPNPWQLTLGVARMWHRVLFRSETIGTCSADPVRASWRARLLERRPFRFPFLVAERAIAPLDFSGLASPPERVIRHLLGAHHDGNQFVYDLALLSIHPGKLEELARRARAVVEGADPRGEWLRDLVVYEGYHERLLATTERALAGELRLSPREERDPDIAFTGYLRWCAAQPETPEATWEAIRAGRYTIAEGLREPQREAEAPAASRPMATSAQ